jgi:hypothetical protein
MLGTGESEYSRLLTEYFNECLEIFCSHEEVNDYVHKFDFYIDRIRTAALMPDYGLLKFGLSKMVEESKRAGKMQEAVRFQKELIFFVLLEGPESDGPGARARSDFHMPREDQVSGCVKQLCELMGANS